MGTRAEEEVRALAADAGLRVMEMRRVGFHGPEAGLWVDDSERVASMTNEDNPTVASKNAVKCRLTDAYNDGIDRLLDEDVLVGACVVAVLVL